jgi:hypothetical protein
MVHWVLQLHQTDADQQPYLDQVTTLFKAQDVIALRQGDGLPGMLVEIHPLQPEQLHGSKT